MVILITMMDPPEQTEEVHEQQPPLMKQTLYC